MISDASHPDEAQEMAESRALHRATSFGANQRVGLKAGQLFANPIYLKNEHESEVSFAPEQSTQATP